MAVVVDSSVLIALERRGAGIVDLITIVKSGPTFIAAITASELLAGALNTAQPERRRVRMGFVESILAELPAVRFDLDTPRIHAGIVFELRRLGKSIGNHDSQIAATAVRT